MRYQCVLTIEELQQYLSGAKVVGFDFETSAMGAYRNMERVALSAHTARITGVSFSVAEGSAIYVPFAHRQGQNTTDYDGVWTWLTTAFFLNPNVVKVAHNLAFEAMFCYVRGVIVQPPYYSNSPLH